MTVCYLGLGSNLNDPVLQLKNALKAIDKLDGVSLTKVSSFYQSQSLLPGQPDYINAVAECQITLEPLVLLKKLQQIEIDLGRQKTMRWGPRIIDLDILLYGDLTITLPELVIPHPEMFNRDFVLVPLGEINPNYEAKKREGV